MNIVYTDSYSILVPRTLFITSICTKVLSIGGFIKFLLYDY